MAVGIVRDSLSGRDFTAVLGYRMYLYTESGKHSHTFPIAPREISYGGIGQEWVTAERNGDTPLLLRKGVKLETISFTHLLVSPVDMHFPQAGAINAIKGLSLTTERIMVRYGPQEVGLWRITDVSIDSELRHPETNEITRATVSMTLTRCSDPAPAVGPVTGGATTQPPTNQPAPQRTYTVVAGDSLWRIAQRHYGNGGTWPRIFDANRGQIRNPNLIYPGQKLVIP